VERSGADIPVVPEEIPVIHFRDALALVGAPEDEPDLAPEHERALGAWALAEHRSDFVAVEGYPMAKRPFYTHPWPGEERWSNSFDLIFRGLELVTGGLAPVPDRGVPPGVRARHAAARRLRDRPGAVDQPAHRRRQRPGGDPLPPRPDPAHPVT
jgi:nondiscriminating aspartyl-tRNA synthetase